jgi:hypothetical protein
VNGDRLIILVLVSIEHFRVKVLVCESPGQFVGTSRLGAASVSCGSSDGSEGRPVEADEQTLTRRPETVGERQARRLLDEAAIDPSFADEDVDGISAHERRLPAV